MVGREEGNVYIRVGILKEEKIWMSWLIVEWIENDREKREREIEERREKEGPL